MSWNYDSHLFAVPTTNLAEIYALLRGRCPADGLLLHVLGALATDPGNVPHVALAVGEGDHPVDADWAADAIQEGGFAAWIVHGSTAGSQIDLRYVEGERCVDQWSLAATEAGFLAHKLLGPIDLEGLVEHGSFGGEREIGGDRYPLRGEPIEVRLPEPAGAYVFRELRFADRERFERAMGLAAKYKLKPVLEPAVKRVLEDPAVPLEELLRLRERRGWKAFVNKGLRARLALETEPSIVVNLLREEPKLMSAKLKPVVQRWARAQWVQGRMGVVTGFAEHTGMGWLIEAMPAQILDPVEALEQALAEGRLEDVRHLLVRREVEPGDLYERALEALGIDEPRVPTSELDLRVSLDLYQAVLKNPDPVAREAAILPFEQSCTHDAGRNLLFRAILSVARAEQGHPVPDGLFDELLAHPHRLTKEWAGKLMSARA